MKMLKRVLILSALLSLVCNVQLYAQSSVFTYQGQLMDGGSYANGFYDLEFTLFDDAISGTSLGVVTNSATAATNGLFTIQLDFGTGVFDGSDLWLEIAAVTNGGGAFNTLSPRQPVTATPYAILSAGVSGTVEASQLSGEIPGGNIGADSITAAMIADGAVGTDQLAAGSVFSGSFFGDGSAVSNVPGTFPVSIVTGSNTLTQFNTAYVSTNSDTVAYTLPSDASVGDVVQISGLGTGDWLIESDSGQLINGYETGLVWNPRESNRDWTAVASSTNGQKLAAVVSGGQIYTSTDGGLSWIPQAFSANWQSITSSADGSKLAAVIYGGLIYTSSDGGLNWVSRESNRSWQSVASSADGTKLVAAVNSGNIYTSNDAGTNWTARASSKYWRSVASSADGSHLVAVDGGWIFSTGGKVYTSNDSGVTWTPRDSSRHWLSVASSTDGTRLVAGVGADGYSGQIYISEDKGTNWTPRASSRRWYSIASSADGSKLTAVHYGGKIYTSTDYGSNWTARASARNWRSISSSSDGSKLIAAASGDQLYLSGPSLIGTAGSSVELQYAGNGVWDAVSVPTSSDNLPHSTVVRDGNGDFSARTITAASFVGNGSGLTSLNASQLTSGTVDDARLSANVAKLNALQTFTGAKTFDNAIGSFSGIFSGDGSALTNMSNHALDAADGNPSQAVFVDNDGKVGIGTQSPASPLHVHTPINNDSVIRMTSGGSWALTMTQDPNSVFKIRNGGSDRFAITPAGRVGIGTLSPSEKLHVVGNIYATGTITPSSDRNLKKNFNPVNTQDVLERVTALPIQQWTYKSEADGVRHVGPMAQDFHAAFGYGANDISIATVDADGVALAAIQGLNEKMEKDIKQLEAENAALKTRLDKLESTLVRMQEGGEVQ